MNTLALTTLRDTLLPNLLIGGWSEVVLESKREGTR